MQRLYTATLPIQRDFLKTHTAILTAVFGLLVLPVVIPGQSQANGARVGEPFTMKIGSRVKVNGTKMSIEFVDVLSDSRCPDDVTCIWAGNAEIQLRLQWKGRPPKTASLNTLQPPIVQEFRNYIVKLARLDPRPNSTRQVDKSDYAATLIVVPADSQK